MGNESSPMGGTTTLYTFGISLAHCSGSWRAMGAASQAVRSPRTALERHLAVGTAACACGTPLPLPLSSSFVDTAVPSTALRSHPTGDSSAAAGIGPVACGRRTASRWPRSRATRGVRLFSLLGRSPSASFAVSRSRRKCQLLLIFRRRRPPAHGKFGSDGAYLERADGNGAERAREARRHGLGLLVQRGRSQGGNGVRGQDGATLRRLDGRPARHL